jgi:sugar phosphate permease
MSGALLLGFIATKFFDANYPPVIAIFFGGLTSCILLIFIGNPIVAVLFIILSLVFTFGINTTLSFTALMDFETLPTASLTAGLFTTAQYIASGLGGFINGLLVENFGYTAWLLAVVPFALCGTIFMSYSIRAYEQSRKEFEEKKNVIEAATKQKPISPMLPRNSPKLEKPDQ